MVDSCVVISSSATSSPAPVHIEAEHKCPSKSSDDDDGPTSCAAITKRTQRVQPFGQHSNYPILSRNTSVSAVQVYPSPCQPQPQHLTSTQNRLTFYPPTIHNKYMSSSTRSRGTQRWMKLRTTVQLTGAVTSAVRDKKPPLKREDSFLKRFSTRQTAEVSDDDDDGDGCPRDIAAQDARRRQRNQRRTVINPDENIYFWWLTVITGCVLYNCWTLIVRQAFPELQNREPALWNTADALCDVLFLLDVVFQLRTGYLEQGLIVYNSRKLAKHYVHSRAFLLDMSSLFPLDLLRLYVSRPAPLLRFPRFLKVYRSYNYYYMVESRTLYPNLWRVVNLIHILLLLAHWFGCFYFLLSEAEGFVGEWVYPKPSGDYAPLTRKYLASLYWSTLTLTTIGDLPTPESNLQARRSLQEVAKKSAPDVTAVTPQAVPIQQTALQRRGLKSRVRLINSDRGYLFTIVSYLIGVFIFATIVGQVGNVITNRNANRLEFERLLDGAKLYMRHHKVPRDMQRRVQRWYDYTWSRGRMHAGGDINTALGILPDKLKTELALHVNLSTLKKVTIFQECQPEFLHDLVLKMKAYIFTPGDLICRKGEVAREMFIIADGILEVISETGKVLTTMKAGDFFGEIGILNLDGLNRRTADVRSVGYSELFSLSREDVLGAMKDYPEAQEILQTMGKKRLMEARKAAVNAKKELSAQESLGSESGKDVIGPDSESARQKAVLMVRRLRRDAKDLRNYLMKSSSKGSSTLFRSKDRSNREDVRIEMEAVNSGRDISKTSVKKRLGSTATDDKHSSGDRADSVEILGQTSVVNEPEPKPMAIVGGRKQSCVDKPLTVVPTEVASPPVARVQSTFLQRVLALKNSQAQQDEGKRPSVSQVSDAKTTSGECLPPAVGSSEGCKSAKSTEDSGSVPKAQGGRKEDSKQPQPPTAAAPSTDDQTAEADRSATAIQAWTATIASSMPFQKPPEKPVAETARVSQPQNPENTERRNQSREAQEGQAVKSILKHFSRSESDVSELFSNSSGDGSSLVAKRKLTKTVSFRDQLAQVNSLADPDASFRQEECVSGLLFGIKHVLQLRLDDIQSQFKMRLVALETAMHNKEDVIHQLEAKIQELETRRDQGSAERMTEDWLHGDLFGIGGEQACGGAEGGVDITHPGFVCHPRRSWPMLPSRQRLSHHRSVDDLLHPDHLWRAEFPTRNPEESGASSPEEETDTGSEITDWEEDAVDDEEEEVVVIPAKDEEERFGNVNERLGGSGSRAANDWEIKMLAQEMIKQEASSKLDLADVAEEEEEEEESIEEAEAGDVVRQLLTSVDVQLANVGKDSGSGTSRNFPRKLCRQQSWAGEDSGAVAAPRRRDSTPTAEDHVIQHFVHSTLRRLDQLEKVFTATPPPSTSGRRNPLRHQCSLQETKAVTTATATTTAVTTTSATSTTSARRGLLHRHASLGESGTHPALSLLNIPLGRPGTRSPPLSSSLFGTPLLPAAMSSVALTSSCVPPSPTHPLFARTMSTIAEPGESNLLNMFSRDRNQDVSDEEDGEEEEEETIMDVRSPATDDDGNGSAATQNPERQPLLSAPRP